MYLPLDSPEFLPYKTFGQKLKLLSNLHSARQHVVYQT
jgi:hypothetical protein